MTEETHSKDASRRDGVCCRMCGSSESLMKHHLLLRKMACWHRLRNATVLLCRACHDSLHKGLASSRRAAHAKLHAALTETERTILAAKPAQEWWEKKDRRPPVFAVFDRTTRNLVAEFDARADAEAFVAATNRADDLVVVKGEVGP